MGVSTDAILFYGYCWSEEARLFGDQEWETVLLARRGKADPWDAMPDYCKAMGYHEAKAAETAWVAEHRADLDAWSEATIAAQEEFGIEVGRHCADGFSMPYVAIAETGASARRGYPKELSAEALKVNPLWDGRLAAWFAALGVEPPQEQPRWWLVSWWG